MGKDGAGEQYDDDSGSRRVGSIEECDPGG